MFYRLRGWRSKLAGWDDMLGPSYLGMAGHLLFIFICGFSHLGTSVGPMEDSFSTDWGGRDCFRIVQAHYLFYFISIVITSWYVMKLYNTPWYRISGHPEHFLVTKEDTPKSLACRIYRKGLHSSQILLYHWSDRRQSSGEWCEQWEQLWVEMWLCSLTCHSSGWVWSHSPGVADVCFTGSFLCVYVLISSFYKNRGRIG